MQKSIYYFLIYTLKSMQLVRPCANTMEMTTNKRINGYNKKQKIDFDGLHFDKQKFRK